LGILDVIYNMFRSPTEAELAAQAAAEARRADIVAALPNHDVPNFIRTRLVDARDGRLPWVATLTPAELRMARSHGFKPIAAIAATCWMHYGWSWTEGHGQGWSYALDRLRAEAKAAGANAVLDVKMRTIPLSIENSMDFTLVGTAVRVEGLPPSQEPVVATVPALEFLKLLEADVVPTGIAIGAYYEWLTNFWNDPRMPWQGNIESKQLSQLWENVRRQAHAQLRSHARGQGNGVLAHLNFSQMFEDEVNDRKRYLARHIVVATTVDARRGATMPHDVRFVVDAHAGGTPLTGTKQHHQSYENNESEGAI
jgi:Putative heavy-metal-binding